MRWVTGIEGFDLAALDDDPDCEASHLYATEEDALRCVRCGHRDLRSDHTSEDAS